MVAPALSESEEDFHSLSDHEADQGGPLGAMEPPVHPVPSMQGAFEESILESTQGNDEDRLSLEKDADTRRRCVLETEKYDDSWRSRWKQTPHAQYHPLQKLIAQIVFGMHLLQMEQAKSDEAVVKILQAHINEVDGFLERTSEDFDLAIKETDERIRYLRLPMEHMDVFETMLDDRRFRTELLAGNEKIERIIDRTAKAMNAALYDIQSAIKATKELGTYLSRVEGEWAQVRSGIVEIFAAMRGNEQGWKNYLRHLQTKGNDLTNSLIMLGTVIGEISKLAAAASRRHQPSTRMSPAAFTFSPGSTGLRSKFAREPPSSPSQRRPSKLLDKPLPREPEDLGAAVRATMPERNKPHTMSPDDKYERPRAPPSSSRAPSKTSDFNPARQRPHTSNHVPRDSRTAQTESTRELADFLKYSAAHSDYDSTKPRSVRTTARLPKRGAHSASHGANDLLVATGNRENRAQVARSMSQGAITLITPESNPDKQREPVAQLQTTGAKLTKSPPATRKHSTSEGSTFTRRISRKLKSLTTSAEADPASQAPSRLTTQGPSRPATQDTAKQPPYQDAKSPGRSVTQSRAPEDPIQTSELIRMSHEKATSVSPIEPYPESRPSVQQPSRSEAAVNSGFNSNGFSSNAETHELSSTATQPLYTELPKDKIVAHDVRPHVDSACASVTETQHNRSRGPSDSSANVRSKGEQVSPVPSNSNLRKDLSVSDPIRTVTSHVGPETQPEAELSAATVSRAAQAQPGLEGPEVSTGPLESASQLLSGPEPLESSSGPVTSAEPPIPSLSEAPKPSISTSSLVAETQAVSLSIAPKPSTSSLEAAAGDSKPETRPTSRLGLFPREARPLTPTQATLRSRPNETFEPSRMASPLAQSSSSGPGSSRVPPKTMTFRKFFHMKRGSQGKNNVVPAAVA